MVAQLFVLAALALGAIAAPTGSADTTKPFRIGVTFGAEGPFFLTATTNTTTVEKEGVLCTIGDKGDVKGVITCNNNLGLYYVDMHPADGALMARPLEDAQKQEKTNVLLTGYVKSNQGWGVDADKVVTWKTIKAKAGPPERANTVHFSRSLLDTLRGVKNQIYADTCSTYGHLDGALFEVGKAMAYFE